MSTQPHKQRLHILAARIALGLIHGALLYWAAEYLNRSEPAYGFAEGEAWNRFINIGRLVAWLGPLPLLFGLGRMPVLRLAAWAAGAVALLFIFGWFGPTTAWESIDGLINVSLFSLIVLFILHELIQSAIDDDKLIASYGAYFGNAWGRGFQVVLALIFLGAYWIVISLGAWMFDLIGLDFIRRAIFSGEFVWITSGLVFAVGAHLADADIGLTRGARQIGLMLLSWLAVLMTCILAAFLLALLFTGLEPLWDTGRATVLLLNAAATMIFLINAAYQDGGVANTAFMRATVRFAALPLLGVVALAALGLWLRVDQYGLTPARVLAAAELVIVAIYAVGYLAAAVKPGRWMAVLEPVNIGAAIAVAVILAALMTPLLSPARISVANQLSRLDRGVVEPDEFDFGFLASRRAGAWGERALADLAARSGSPRDERIALLAQNPGEQRPYGFIEQSISARRDALRLIDEGELPDGVVLRREGADPVEGCLNAKRNFDDRVAETARILAQPERLRPKQYAVVTAEDEPLKDGRCLVRLIDIDFDGDEDAVIVPYDPYEWARHPRGGRDGMTVLIQDEAAAWTYAGALAVRPEFTDSLAVADFRGLNDDQRRLAVAEELRKAEVIANPKKDLSSLGQRLQLTTGDEYLSPETMRARLRMGEGGEPPAALLRNLPAPLRWNDCAPEGAEKTGLSLCHGLYRELTAAEPLEFLFIRIDGAFVNVTVYEDIGAGWVSHGAASADYEDVADALFGEADLRWSYSKERVEFAEKFLEDVAVVEPLYGDIVMGDIQYMVRYER